MSSLTAARLQMELSLAFHMVFAALGIGLPLLMVLAEGLYLRTKQQHYKTLAKKWSKATALLFVVGAVSGTALSFELGLLWPRFMAFAGPIIGPSFALEGYAFLLEAIFVGLYLYGWERLSPKAHWWTGVPVAVSGMLSGVLVVGSNSWMQSPMGYTLQDGRVVSVDPLAAFKNGRFPTLALHSTLSCYIAVGFCVAGVYAYGILRGRNDLYHRSGLLLGMAMGAVAALLQLPSGDWAAKVAARMQPEKFAAMEAHFETAKGVPLLILGIPDADKGTVDYGIHVPKMLSFLAHGDFDSTVKGLREFPREDWPNVTICHIGFQIMVGCGMALVAVGALFFGYLAWKRKLPSERWILGGIVAASPLGFIALEAGWFVTEVGRQPWIVYHVMRTSEAVTPRSDVQWTLLLYVALYTMLAVGLIALLRGLVGHDTATTAEDPALSKEVHDVAR